MSTTTAPLSAGEQAVLVWLADCGDGVPSSAAAVAAGLADRLGKSRVYAALDTLAGGGLVAAKSHWRSTGICLTEAGRTEGAAIEAAEHAANAVRAGNPAPDMPSHGRPAGTLPLDCLQPGGLNPRQMFDDAAIDELADSIRRAGVLQNLVVRPLPRHAVQTAAGDDPHELVAGERRWRALRLLADRGDIAADYSVPVHIVEMDDAEALMLAITENAQRADVHPLDEGEAFLALYERTEKCGGDASQVATRIAQETGKTRRWVEKRIALARRLAPATRDAFRAGEITLAQAQAVSAAGPALQARAVKLIADGAHGWQTASDIWAQIRVQAVPVAHGWGIGEADYTEAGGVILDIDGAPHYDDRELFLKLQKVETKARVEALQHHRAWVRTERWYPAWRYQTAPDDVPDAETGCIIVPANQHDTRTYIHDRLVERQPESAHAPADPTPWAGPEWTDPHLAWAADVKTDALQAALLDHPHVALALMTVFGLTMNLGGRAQHGSAGNAARAGIAAALYGALGSGVYRAIVHPDHASHAAARPDDDNGCCGGLDARCYPVLCGDDGTWGRAMDALAAHFRDIEDRDLLWPLVAIAASRTGVSPPWDVDEMETVGDGEAYTVARLCGLPAIDHAAALDIRCHRYWDLSYGEIASPARKLALARAAGVPDEQIDHLQAAIGNDMPMATTGYGDWLRDHATQPIHLPELAWRAPQPHTDAGDHDDHDEEVEDADQ